WSGDAELSLFEAPTEELAVLRVDEVIGAYYRQVGVTWNGGRVLESRPSEPGSGERLESRCTP
ncbi:acetoacetate decarboxylase family protein, partial [Kibdelosporangium lantanae]